MRTLCLLVGLIVMLWGAVVANAHDSPEHVIEDLTILINKKGASADLLYRRACEYRAMRQYAKAAVDLNAALKLDRRFVPAYLELGRLELEQKRTDDAWRNTELARIITKDANELARLALLRSDIQYARAEPVKALSECEEACRLVPGDVDYLLRRSQLQAELGSHAIRMKDLEAACQANPSVVLAIELVEARIDAGQVKVALEQIEKELADSRWQSSWLIRRARVWQTLGQPDAAKKDLEAAIAEINQRLNPQRPDLTLVVDRGFANALLGNTKAAQADLAVARTAKADPALLYRLTKALAPPAVTSPKSAARSESR